MELAVHMKNTSTGKKRIKRIEGTDASPENWICDDFFYGSEWVWTGTECWDNIKNQVRQIGNYYEMVYDERNMYLK